jgi:hypothetical protein
MYVYVCSVVAARNEIEDEDEEGALKDFMGCQAGPELFPAKRTADMGKEPD